MFLTPVSILNVSQKYSKLRAGFDKLFTPTKKVGFCPVDKKISLRFQQDFPYTGRIVFSAVLDSKSADTKAGTLSTGQKCRNIKNLAINFIV